MTESRSGPAGKSIGRGLRAGGLVGLLTGLCYIFFFGGLDFSRGNPIQPLLTLPLRTIGLFALLVALGAGAGAIVSAVTPDE